MKKVICTLIVISLVGYGATILAAPGTTPKAKGIVLKAVSMLPKVDPTMNTYNFLIQKVNQRAKGELVIDYLGGPEAFAMKEQAMAVQKGSFDMCMTATSFYLPLVPASDAFQLSEITWKEERENGFYDFYNALHKKAGLFYLGRVDVGWPGESYTLFTNKEVKSPKDLVGQRFAPATLAYYGLKELGIVTLPIPQYDFYTSLQKGVMDGIIYPFNSVHLRRWHEVLKYVIDHPFLSGNCSAIMNLASWNRLPKPMKDLIVACQIEAEREAMQKAVELRSKAHKALTGAGIEFVKFSAADAKRFKETILAAEWDGRIKKYPDIAPKYRELLSKKEGQ